MTGNWAEYRIRDCKDQHHYFNNSHLGHEIIGDFYFILYIF